MNVRLADRFDSSLDWNTLQLVDASHRYRAAITDGYKMEFMFENINLPHEAVDTPGSNGFIAYKIKPKAGTQVGDTLIGNKVNIYFDYNLPIVTNAVSTRVIQAPLSVAALDAGRVVSLYPNPASDILYIETSEGVHLQHLKIYAMDGREIPCQEKHLEAVDITHLGPGAYIIRIATNKGVVTRKIIKTL